MPNAKKIKIATVQIAIWTVAKKSPAKLTGLL
jgi:hypothetical protein